MRRVYTSPALRGRGRGALATQVRVVLRVPTSPVATVSRPKPAKSGRFRSDRTALITADGKHLKNVAIRDITITRDQPLHSLQQHGLSRLLPKRINRGAGMRGGQRQSNKDVSLKLQGHTFDPMRERAEPSRVPQLAIIVRTHIRSRATVLAQKIHHRRSGRRSFVVSHILDDRQNSRGHQNTMCFVIESHSIEPMRRCGGHNGADTFSLYRKLLCQTVQVRDA